MTPPIFNERAVLQAYCDYMDLPREEQAKWTAQLDEPTKAVMRNTARRVLKDRIRALTEQEMRND